MTERRGVRDRDVVLVAAGVVVVILALNLVSALFPPLDRLLAAAPIVVLAMVAVTAVVLLRALRSGASRDG